MKNLFFCESHRGGIVRGPRKLDTKDRALPRFTLCPHSSTLRLDQLFHDRKAKPGAASRTSARVVRAVETLEDERQVFRRNAWTTVRDGDVDVPVVVDHARANFYSTIRWRVGNRVCKQVSEHLRNALRVRGNRRKTRGHINAKVDLLADGLIPHCGDRLIDEGAEVGRLAQQP